MGFPSPAQDYVERQISLDELCIVRPSATYFMRSDSHYPAVGILKNSLLVVDSSVRPVNGSLVIASHEGQLFICRLKLSPVASLISIEDCRVLSRFDDGEADEIFGVVTYIVSNTAGI